jgi:hypothetical protein
MLPLALAPDQVTQVNPDPRRIRIQNSPRRLARCFIISLTYKGYIPAH